MPRKFVLLLLTALLATEALAIERKSFAEIDFEKFTSEVQQTSMSDIRRGAVVWWIPKEYWNVSLRTQNPVQLNAVLNVVGDYLILAVAQFSLSETGELSYYSEEEILDGMRVHRYRDGRDDLRLTPMTFYEGNTGAVLEGLADGLRQTMGEMGRNLRFFVFEDRFGQSRFRHVDPYEKGSLVIELKRKDGDSHILNFETPLDALFVPRRCPNGKPAHVSWTHCPWSGHPLDAESP